MVEAMGGLRLEAFKFGLYLTIPIFALLHFGDPEWYRKNVVPVRSITALTDSSQRLLAVSR